MCEFARGEVVWSLSLHVFLMDEHRAEVPGVIFYKGTSPSEVQLAVGVDHTTTVATENRVIPGCHPIVIRYTHDGRLKTLVIPHKFVEIYRWAHLVVALDSNNMTVIMNGEIIFTHTLQCELMVNFQPGHQDTFLGAPPWEYGRSTTGSAWVYQLTLVAGTALEVQQARELKAQDELRAWLDNAADDAKRQKVQFNQYGVPGVDDLPDPVHLPGLPVQIFDPRLKVASEEGIAVLCDLLKDPLEAQKQAAGQALRNLADPAVVTNMRRVVNVLLKEENGERRMDNVYQVMLEAKGAATFEAIAELATNLLTWIPVGGDGIDRASRLELIKHMVKRPPDAAVTEARAPIVVRQLLLLIHFQENVKCLADPSVGAMDTFFHFLTLNFQTVTRTQEQGGTARTCCKTLTIHVRAILFSTGFSHWMAGLGNILFNNQAMNRFKRELRMFKQYWLITFYFYRIVPSPQDLLIKLLAGPLPELRQQWAEEICQAEKFQRFMQQQIRQDDRRTRASG